MSGQPTEIARLPKLISERASTERAMLAEMLDAIYKQFRKVREPLTEDPTRQHLRSGSKSSAERLPNIGKEHHHKAGRAASELLVPSDSQDDSQAGGPMDALPAHIIGRHAAGSRVLLSV